MSFHGTMQYGPKIDIRMDNKYMKIYTSLLLTRGEEHKLKAP